MVQINHNVNVALAQAEEKSFPTERSHLVARNLPSSVITISTNPMRLADFARVSTESLTFTVSCYGW